MQPTALADALGAWLRRVTAQEKPAPSIVAFNIGLFESVNGFTAYLAGAEHYDADDDEWACDEAFTPDERYLELPVRRRERTWEEVQALVASAARDFLASPDGARSFLAKADAVTVGFDDGILERVK